MQLETCVMFGTVTIPDHTSVQTSGYRALAVPVLRDGCKLQTYFSLNGDSAEGQPSTTLRPPEVVIDQAGCVTIVRP
jgi:hypothetical protein